jgi:phage FluMu protein Com
MIEFRCRKCNKLLAKYTQCLDLEIKCGRCGMRNQILQSDTPVRCAIISNASYFVPLTRSKTISAGASLR